MSDVDPVPSLSEAIITIQSNLAPKRLRKLKGVPYSWKLLREKTFKNR